MKKLILLVALIHLNYISSFGQESYMVKMTLKMEGMPPEYAAYGEQETVNYLKGDKYKMERTSMMGSNITCFDGKMLTSLSDQMGNKTGYTATKAELDSANKNTSNEAKPKIEYTEEKKTIAGYECKKAILTSLDKENKEQKMTVWVTDKIKSTAAKGRRTDGRGMQMNFGDLNGYPLQIEASRNQMGSEIKMVITATEVSTAPIDDAEFKVSTEGYTMMSYKEMQKQMKAMKKGAE